MQTTWPFFRTRHLGVLTTIPGIAVAIAVISASPVSAGEEAPKVPGYTYGEKSLPRSPVSLEEFDLLKETVLFSDEDVRFLHMSLEVLRPQINEILDVWYGFVASKPQLLQYFSNPTTREANTEYLGQVRMRFGQWILDTATADYDQAWLDYQYEIGRRHHRVAKNRTDGADRYGTAR